MAEPITLHGKDGQTVTAYGLAQAATLLASGVWFATVEQAKAAGKGGAAVKEPVTVSAPPAPAKPVVRKGKR